MQNRSNLPIVLETKQLPTAFPLQCLHYTQRYRQQATLHYHDCLEIGHCLSGSGMMFLDGHVCSFGPDTLCVLPSGCVHDSGIIMDSPQQTPSTWRYVFVDMVGLGVPVNSLHGLSTQDAVLRGLMDVLFVLHADQPPGWQEDALHLLQVLAAQIERLQPAADSAAPDACSQTVMHAQHRIAVDYAAELTVEGLARECSMSVSFFRKQFRQVAGVSPQEFLIRTRLSVAEHLLKNSSDKIIVISERAGFRTLSSFNRHFLSHYGCTPSAFRAKTKEQR